MKRMLILLTLAVIVLTGCDSAVDAVKHNVYLDDAERANLLKKVDAHIENANMALETGHDFTEEGRRLVIKIRNCFQRMRDAITNPDMSVGEIEDVCLREQAIINVLAQG